MSPTSASTPTQQRGDDPQAPTVQTPRRRPGRAGTAALAAVAAVIVLGVAAGIVLLMVGGGSGGPAEPGGPAANAAITEAFGGNAADGPLAAAGAPGGPGGGPKGHGKPDGAASGVLDQVTHGEFTLDAAAGGRTVEVQRGQLLAVTPSTVTVRSPDGFTASYRVEPGVTMTKNGQSATVSELATGDQSLVVAARDATGLAAQTVTVD